MDATAYGYDETPTPALGALYAVASELPLKAILTLCPLYRVIGDDPTVQTSADYHET